MRTNDFDHSSATVDDCRIIKLETHANARGNIAVAKESPLPFAIRRVFYIYDIPSGTDRGGHSHLEEHEYVVGVSGSFEVTVDDGAARRTFTLNRPNEGLYIPPGIWTTLHNFSSGCVVLSLSSDNFNESNYIRDYDRFLKTKSQ